ncbi:MAG: L-threonylcarbamoyladenylate synthase [Sediminibacterium sp.]|nr:L-threonylcarbamoyladenylate synthase [Sediminibacterium sp.]
MLLKIHPTNPEQRHIQKVVECLQNGGLIIYPTDTVYALGCSIYQPKSIDKICQIKNTSPAKAMLSFICNDLSHLSTFVKPISTPIFRILKNNLPGPYTFILAASLQTPKILHSKRKTIGLRIPDNNISMSIVKTLGHPILTASFPVQEEGLYFTDPEEIFDKFGKIVDLVIDGGIGKQEFSTIIDCTSQPPSIIREGLGLTELKQF